jgi:hypothetical protein
VAHFWLVLRVGPPAERGANIVAAPHRGRCSRGL